MVLVLQLGLRTFASASDRLRIISVKGTTGLCMVQLGTILVITGNQQCHAKRSAHDTLLAVRTLTKPQCQITDSLRAALDPEGLGEVEGVRLRFDTGVLDHAASVGLQARHGAANVLVNFDDLLDGRGLEQGRCHALLDT
jgi:hypothetical protein